MSVLTAPGALPIAPARAIRPRRALVSARSVVSKNSTDEFSRARVASRVSCRPTGRRAVRVSCRASADARDGGDDALPWKPASILADLTNGDGPTETERRPNRASSDDESRARSRRGPAKTLAATALGGAALFAAASMLPAGFSPAAPRPATASPTATASSSASVGSTSAASVESRTSAFKSSFAVYKEYSAGEIFAYKAQKVFALPLLGKVACLFILTIPIVFVGGLGYKLVDALDGVGDGDDESFREKLKSAYFNLFDIPGADATTDETWRSGVVTQAIVFVGMFVFAVIIGIISDEIATKVEEVKTGNNKVIEKDHTVVVNWNSQLVPLLKQMAVAKSERLGTFDKPVVLLADVEKEVMDELVESALEDSPGNLEVVTRRGNPFDAEDLLKVNAFDARRVVILHPHERDVGLLGSSSGNGDESSQNLGGHFDSDTDADSKRQRVFQKQQREEALKATVVLNLLADHGRESFPDVIVQMPYRMPPKQDLVAHALKLASDGVNGQREDDSVTLTGESFRVSTNRGVAANAPYVQVHGSENTGKISAFAAFQPGTSRIFEELFTQSEDTPEFYLSHAPQFVGKTFGEAWRMLPEATLCGLSHADGSVTLAPRDDAVINDTDEVVMLSETSTVVVAAAADVAGTPAMGSQRHYMKLMPDTRQGPVKLLFAGWNGETAVALTLAQSMAPAGSEITVLSNDAPPAALKSTKNCKLRVVRGVPTAYVDLERAKVHSMDAVVIMPDHSQGKAEEDASVLATILQTRAVCADFADAKGLRRAREPHVVATLNTETARSIVQLMGRVGNGDNAPDVIMSDEIVGGALLQVAANPRLAGLFDALLATDGHEMYLRDADAYGGADTRVKGSSFRNGEAFQTVTWGTICERARERDELALGVMREDGTFVISPGKAEAFRFEKGDRVVVLADHL
jgi:hypothetical protein